MTGGRVKAGIRRFASPESAMPARQKDPLGPLTPEKLFHLENLSRSRTDPAAQVMRAKELLAVADGASFEGAAWHHRRSLRAATAPIAA